MRKFWRVIRDGRAMNRRVAPWQNAGINFMRHTSCALFLMLCLSGFVFGGSYGGGTGSADDPFQIWTAEEMNSIGLYEEDWDKCFVLMCDIDLKQYSESMYNRIGYFGGYNDPENTSFNGAFDGNGKMISNFTYSTEDSRNAGIFGSIGTGTVSNLIISDPNVKAPNALYVGVLAGNNDEGMIDNCHIIGGTVWGRNFVGAIAGRNYAYGEISNCSASSEVLGVSNVGGLAGLGSGRIDSCGADGKVVGYHAVGGLLGSSGSGFVINCYSAGIVEGEKNVGGLIGLMGEESGCRWCYSACAVEGQSHVGGIVGECENVPLNSFWNIEVSGVQNGIGLSIWEPDTTTGLSSQQMRTLQTYIDAGWDFVGEDVNGGGDIWRMCVDGVGYPRLSWEYSFRGDFVCGDGVGFGDLVYFCEGWLGDGEFDFGGFGVLAENWLAEGWME